MGKGVLWNGKYYLIPQAASRIDSSALANSPLGGANKVAILAEMVGLVPPGTAVKINSPSLVNQLIHPSAAEARLGAKLLVDPSPGAQGASEVYLVPVNPSAAAAATFSSALTLTTYLYGNTANQVKAKIEAGTNIGKKLTVAYMDNIETFDDISKSSLSVIYTGAGLTATLSIDVTSTVHLLTTTVADTPADDLSLDLTTFNTIQALVDAINATGKYTATALTSKPKDDLSMYLDNATAVDIKTAAATFKSDLQAIVERINTMSAYVTATRAAEATVVPANVAWTYLTGGSDGTTTNATWQSALDLLKTMKIDLIVPLTDDASIHTMVDAHCVYMSGPNGKSERRCFVGGALQAWNSEAARLTSIAALKTSVDGLNSDRTMLVGLGSKHYDDNGALQLYPAYITACMYAGIAGGSSPVEPLTRKYLRCFGLEVNLRISEIETMLEYGVAVPIPDAVQGAGYVISRQLTTWNQDDDLYRLEFSVGRGADYIAREIRNRHELLIGKPGTESLDITIVNLTNAVLEAAKREGYIRNFDAKLTQLRVDGTIRYVDYYAEPILPVNHIFSTYHLEPTKFSIGL
jgi:hypothetical protein